MMSVLRCPALGVAAQHAVHTHLLGAEQSGLRQVSLQVLSAQFGLQEADLTRRRFNAGGCCRALREQGVAVPALLISGHLTSGVARQASVAGIPVIEKPFLGNGLFEAIRVAVHNRSS